MKFNNILGLLMILVFFPTFALAQTDEAEKGGFFGNIVLGGGFSAGRPSQLHVTDDNKSIDSLNEKAVRQERGIPYIMGELGYDIASTGTKISIGNQKGERSMGALALEQSLGGMGLVRATVGYGQEDVWADPYLTKVRREETDETSYNVTLEFEEIAGTGAMASLKLSDIDVDKDMIGERYRDLRRDGQRMGASIGFGIPLGESQVVIPSFEIVIEDRDGESNSGMQYKLELAHLMGLGSWSFATSVALFDMKFDKVHPVFHATRDERGIEVNELITYEEPFGWEGFSIMGLITYTRMDSNIDFFSTDELTAGMGIGYSF